MSNKTIAPIDTPDPWMIAANGVFYLTFTLANRIEIWESPLMEDFFNARKTVVWKPEPGSRWSADIWAPELHWLNGVWYIYATASHPGAGNPAHRTIVLRSHHQDPMEASGWQFLGPLKGMPEQFSIDATVFSPNGQDLYICWSGWPPGDNSDTQQNLYLAQMVTPEEIVAENILPPVCIATADLDWERFERGKRGINEGPTWLNLPNGAFTGIVYSGHASFTSEYKLGLLRLVHPNADPLDPKSWVKRPTPLLMNDQSRPGPYAPGHASFLLSPHPGDNRVFCVYHATAKWGEGFGNRKARIMAIGPEAFADNQPPLCCSHGPHNPAWNGGGVVGPPTNHQERMPKISRKMDQYASQAPAPVKKVYDKFKKLL